MQGDQQALIPIGIQRTEPAPFGSADCTHFGIGFDGLPYILKRVTSHNPLMPASELICARMAAASQIACATGCMAKLPDGENVFASRAEAIALNAQETAVKLLSDSKFLSTNLPTLAAIYAFDVFVRNTDRHFGNYLVRQTFAGIDLMAVDHSRALLVERWPLNLLKLPDCNTTNCQKKLREKGKFSVTDALAAIDRLLNLEDDWLSRNICDIPETWWSIKDRPKVEKWWIRHRKNRLNRLRRRILNENI